MLRTPRRLLLLVLLAITVSAGACAGEPAPRVMTARSIPVAAQVVVAGCSMCMFQDKPFTGCFWAVELEGKRYTVEGGALPKDHDTHGPEGMCQVKREVTIEGWIDGGTFVATRFDLLPFEAGKHEQPDGPAH
jgi:hypothetical protein